MASRLFMFCSLYWDIYAVRFNHKFNDRTVWVQ